ncbi:MAG TPA: DUF6119 family protein [Coriobacteriia bacterium]
MAYLRVLLLKQNVVEFADALKQDEGNAPPEPIALKSGLGLDGVLYLRPPVQKPPAWLAFVQSGTELPIDYKTATAGALVLLRAHGRMFAIPFGYGRLLLKPSSYVRDFGVKVALNSIEPEQGIRSLDTRTVEELTVHTKVLVSRATNLSVFRMNKTRDLLRSLGGKPREGLPFGRKLEGADAFSVSMDVAFGELADCCGTLKELYESDRYIENGFGFFDNLRIVSEPDLIEELDAKLDEALAEGDATNIHLSLPDAMDLGDVEWYKYRGHGAQFDDMDIDEMLSELTTAGLLPTAEWLKGHYLRIGFSGAPEHDYPKCELYECLVFETRLDDDAVYILSAGEWHRASDAFVASVDQRVAQLPVCEEALPPCADGQDEGAYNLVAAPALGFACMDKENINFGGYDKLEFCDLLDAGGRFFHVKKRSKSSTLSHLFMQGLNSARLFLESPEFRALAKAKVETVSAAHAGVIPQAAPDTSQYEVVFAVIARPDQPVPSRLPFFSRLSLAETSEIITGMGYRVSVAHIPQVPGAVAAA